jgi:hypothetical protein
VTVQRFPWIILRVCNIEWVLAVVHAASARVFWTLINHTQPSDTASDVETISKNDCQIPSSIFLPFGSIHGRY